MTICVSEPGRAPASALSPVTKIWCMGLWLSIFASYKADPSPLFKSPITTSINTCFQIRLLFVNFLFLLCIATPFIITLLLTST